MKKRFFVILLALLLTGACVGCGSVSSNDMMADELARLTPGKVTEAVWWCMNGDEREEGELSAEQLKTAVSALNQVGKHGVGKGFGSTGLESSAAGIRLDVGGNLWEVKLTYAANKVEIYMAEQDYSVTEESAALAALLEELSAS